MAPSSPKVTPAWEAQIYDDLKWLGLCWEEPVMRQSDRLPTYQAALDALWARGVLYPCTCSRRDVEAALSAPQEGVPIAMGPIETPVCHMVMVQDPEGNVVILHQRKSL